MFRRRNISGGDNFKGEIFEVIEAGTGYGIYSCQKKKLISDEWDDTDSEDKLANDYSEGSNADVMNLEENDPVAVYTPALGKYDRLLTWLIFDSNNVCRRLGIPLVTTPRLARAVSDAGASTDLTCNLILNNGNPAQVAELGYHITVYARIKGGGNLNGAVPKIESGDDMMVVNRQGRWEFATDFQGVEVCDCYTAS